MFNWHDMEDIQQDHERRPGRATWPLSTRGPHPAPTCTTGQGPASSPETQTSGFRQDSTPKRGSEGVRKANRKKTTIARKHCTFFFFFFVRVAQIPLQSCRYWAGAPRHLRLPHWPSTSARCSDPCAHARCRLLTWPHEGGRADTYSHLRDRGTEQERPAPSLRETASH